MEDILKQILAGQKQLLTQMDNINHRLTNLEGQTQENTDIIKAVRHNTETINAEINGLKINTASKESIDRIETKIDILTHRVLAQDGEIQLLKKVK